MQARSKIAVAAALLTGLTACSGGGSGGSGVQGTSGNFVVLSTSPDNNGKLFLNDPIAIDFSNPVKLSSVDRNTFAFEVFDLLGNRLNEQPFGRFELDDIPGDPGSGVEATGLGRRLLFLPKFPTNRTFDDGGFLPGRRYVLTLVGGRAGFGTVLEDISGKPLREPVTFQFSTSDGLNPALLFRDQVLGGPRRAQPPLIDFEANPRNENGRVELSRLSQKGVEVRLRFNQPLNPSPENVPVEISPDPTERDSDNKGRIFLEYDDVLGETWIPATVDLESNDNEGAAVVLRPIGVLPNNALIRVIVEDTLEDLAGESNVSDEGYVRLFASFETAEDFDPQFDALVDAFDSGMPSSGQAGDGTIDMVTTFDPNPIFLEPEAELVDGVVRATFNYEGGEANLEYEPIQREIFLNTNSTEITPVGLPPINVTGGVFRFRRVTIPEGVKVQGTGSNPMVWLVNGDFTVNGILSVDGEDGTTVSGLGAANQLVPGGAGNCGGGDGGDGSPETDMVSAFGGAGNGAGQVLGQGGGPGRLGCEGCVRGSGGGGGSFATQGDPHFPVGENVPIKQLAGTGGNGCAGQQGSPLRALPGGDAAVTPFLDRRKDNDFWGSGVDMFRGIRIAGELADPRGGSGGGSGGDRSLTGCNPVGQNFISNSRGGGGGGGAGVLIIKALGKIIVGPRGRISANGGHGGGGQAAGSNNEGGAGGAGAGGMVILQSGEGIDIFVHTTSTLSTATYG
ncbi:MAG: hypothetical protein ACYTG5_16025, partial [Planctomycetota bacterium]